MKNTQKKQPVILIGTFGKLQLIEDNLPSPDQLGFKSSPTKVTLNLNRKTLDYFKTKAQELGGSYQRMIRNLLDLYVEQVKARESSK